MAPPLLAPLASALRCLAGSSNSSGSSSSGRSSGSSRVLVSSCSKRQHRPVLPGAARRRWLAPAVRPSAAAAAASVEEQAAAVITTIDGSSSSTGNGDGGGVRAEIYGIPRAEWLRLQAPARYLGNEFGAVRKPWADADVRFALTYPEVYEVGASNLGHIILYGLLNGADRVLCDRAYFPGPDLTELLARHGGKPLFGIETRRPLRDFDVLGFSLSYELGGSNILEMLSQSGIPLTWQLGKTQCIDTFVGYKCACGEGFYTHTNDKGEEECLDVNECWSAGTSLGHNCTCDRCACHNTWGSYECLTDLPNKCTEEQDYGGCWRKKFAVHGKDTLFTACKDNLSAFKAAAANGEEMANFPIHTCECPPCFVKDGANDCKPACNLDHCDANSGMCSDFAGGSAAGFPGWAFAVIVVAAVVVVAAGGYFVYWFRLRSAMHSEIRAIMAQYMPLDAAGGPPPPGMGGGGLGMGMGGGESSTEMISKTPNGI